MPCFSACIVHFVVQTRTDSAILKLLPVSIVLTQPSCRLVIQPCMKSSTSVLALRSLRALEVIGSDSDLVAQAT
jgi:hypothetical protein